MNKFVLITTTIVVIFLMTCVKVTVAEEHPFFRCGTASYPQPRDKPEDNLKRWRDQDIERGDWTDEKQVRFEGFIEDHARARERKDAKVVADEAKRIKV